MSGGMPGGLRYSEISCYAKDHGYGSCPDDLDEFVYLVQRMDQAYLKHANDSRPPK